MINQYAGAISIKVCRDRAWPNLNPLPLLKQHVESFSSLPFEGRDIEKDFDITPWVNKLPT
jgi:hypothetical protein